MREVAIIAGLWLLSARVLAWEQGQYQPDWSDIAAGLLIGFAIGEVIL